jgi:hypothetical protein
MEQTSNARVTFSRRRPFPKLQALVLPSSLSTLPPLFLIVAPASFLPSAKKGGNCTDVILGAIIIGGIIIAVQARRTSASIGVMNLLAPSGTRQCQSGDVFSDHHDFGSDPRWLKLYYIISHLLAKCCILVLVRFSGLFVTVAARLGVDGPFVLPTRTRDILDPRIRIGLHRTTLVENLGTKKPRALEPVNG